MNENRWLIIFFIGLALSAVCGFLWGTAYPGLLSQPAPATQIPQYVGNGMFVNVTGTIFGSIITAHYTILYVDSTDKIIPTSINAESGQLRHCETWGTGDCVIHVPATAPTSTEWSCPDGEIKLNGMAKCAKPIITKSWCDDSVGGREAVYTDQNHNAAEDGWTNCSPTP